MKNRNDVIEMYVEGFNLYLKEKRFSDPSFYPNQNDILDSIKRSERYFEGADEMLLSDAEKKITISKIESLYGIYQEEGSVILGDYEDYHDIDWYNKLLKKEGCVEYYWPRYKNYLSTQKHLAPAVIDVLENNTLPSLMSYLGDPNCDRPFSIRGLVVGDVQSGKTSNYLGLITKASDAGYKVVFILTGTIESLRRQTQQRVEEGFVGFDSLNGMDVGVGRGDDEKMPKAFTSRSKDFTAGDNQNTTYRISDYQHMIFVVKKNVSVLKKIYSSLKQINTTASHPKINYPMLMIDDEADNASVNTSKPDNDPTKINKYIRSILSLFTKTSYVGFTATPFANVFINYDSEKEMIGNDLFPRHFIYALKAPSNYCGSRKYFFTPNENVKYITDDNQNVFPMKHKKDWAGNHLYDSLYHSINTFAITNAIRDIRDVDKRTHRSMLINMSRFTKVQGVIKDIVEEYFSKIKKTIKFTHRLKKADYSSNPYAASLKDSFNKEFKHCTFNGKPITWEQVAEQLYDSIKDIKIVIVNSSKQSEKINYDDHSKDGLRVIAVGGLALSRGLTLEGLVVSYFYRNTSTFDVLMQMGRWFGYREGYGDLCRIFITPDSASYYKEICQDIEFFKNDIEIMNSQNKTPKDYGIRIRNASIDLSITAANKMRNTMVKVIRKSYYGNVFETPYLHRDLETIEFNVNETYKLLDKIKIAQRDFDVANHPYFRDVNSDIVIDFLSMIKLHPANEDRFNIKEITKFINKNKGELGHFDLLIMGGSSPLYFDYPSLKIHSQIVKRKFDIYGPSNNKFIRVNKQRAHLIGRSDTKNGLDEKYQKKIPDCAPTQEYMIEGRNPLFIIYFIDLKNEDDPSSESSHTDITDKLDYLNFLLEASQKHFKYAVGFAIGFPMKEGADTSATLFTVNKTADYFEQDHEEYKGEDENE